MTKEQWANPISWDDVVCRSGGRRKYNSRRQLIARLRRQAVARRLRQVGFKRGVQQQLAREFGVAPCVISTDIRRLLMERVTGRVQVRQAHQRQQKLFRNQEGIMGCKISTRLPDPLHARLLIIAQARNVTPSDIIREALERFNTQTTDIGANPQRADKPTPDRHDPDGCAQRLLAMLPPEIRAQIMEKANLLGYPVVKVMTSLLIAQVCPPRRATSQV